MPKSIKRLSELRTVTELRAALTELGYSPEPPYEPDAVFPDGSPEGFAVDLPKHNWPTPNTWKEASSYDLRCLGHGYVVIYPDLGERSGEVRFYVDHTLTGELIEGSWGIADPYAGEMAWGAEGVEAVTLNELRDRALIWMAAWDDPRTLEFENAGGCGNG